jgi:hypothetical protein
LDHGADAKLVVADAVDATDAARFVTQRCHRDR